MSRVCEALRCLILGALGLRMHMWRFLEGALREGEGDLQEGELRTERSGHDLVREWGREEESRQEARLPAETTDGSPAILQSF